MPLADHVGLEPSGLQLLRQDRELQWKVVRAHGRLIAPDVDGEAAREDGAPCRRAVPAHGRAGKSRSPPEGTPEAHLYTWCWRRSMPWYASMPMCGVGLKGLRVCVSAQPRSSAASTSPHSQRSAPPGPTTHHLPMTAGRAPMRTVMMVVGFPLAAAAPAEHPSSRSCRAEHIASSTAHPRTDPSSTSPPVE